MAVGARTASRSATTASSSAVASDVPDPTVSWIRVRASRTASLSVTARSRASASGADATSAVSRSSVSATRCSLTLQPPLIASAGPGGPQLGDERPCEPCNLLLGGRELRLPVPAAATQHQQRNRDGARDEEGGEEPPDPAAVRRSSRLPCPRLCWARRSGWLPASRSVSRSVSRWVSRSASGWRSPSPWPSGWPSRCGRSGGRFGRSGSARGLRLARWSSEGRSEGCGVLVRLGRVRVGLGTDAVTDPTAVRVGLAVGSREPSPPSPPPQALSRRCREEQRAGRAHVAPSHGYSSSSGRALTMGGRFPLPTGGSSTRPVFRRPRGAPHPRWGSSRARVSPSASALPRCRAASSLRPSRRRGPARAARPAW